MQPGENHSEIPPRGRPPLPRRRHAGDGFSSFPTRRPVMQLSPAPRTTQVTSPQQPPVQAAVVSTTMQPPTLPTPPVVPPPPVQTTAAPQPSAPPVPYQLPDEAQIKAQLKAKKQRRKLNVRIKLTKAVVLPAAVGLGIFMLGGGIYSYLGWQAKQNDPASLLSKALTNNLGQEHVAIETTSSAGTNTALLSAADYAKPAVSGSVAFKRYGQPFTVEVYGSKAKGYFKYSSLPGAISAQTAASAKGVWVQSRSSESAQTADRKLASSTDPYTHMYGPVLLGNYPDPAREELVAFMLDKVYKPKTDKPKLIELGNEKVYEMPIKLEVGFLKVAVLSAATNAGLKPQDVQAAVAGLDSFKGSSATLYISKKESRIVRFVAAGPKETVTIDYKFGDTQVGTEPSAKTVWAAFLPREWQLRSQAAAAAAQSDLDNERRQDMEALKAALASYRAQNGYYPTAAAFSDGSWLKSIIGSDLEWQRDPQSASLAPVPAAKPGAYAYIPTAANGKSSCDAKNPCFQYRLIATLSNGQHANAQGP